MMKAKKAQLRTMISAVALMALPATVFAQGYYDDDIYFNPSKAPMQKTEDVYSTPARTVTTVVYPGADTYVFTTGSKRDVDEYNRHGRFLVSDTATADTVVDSYAATRRIQRFHNSDIVNNLTDDQYATYVLTEPSVVNIYVNNDPWSYYTPYWRYGCGTRWYNYTWGLYDPFWGPSWAWYDPYWSWNLSWGWGWGPSWSWGWGPGWGGPAWGPGWGHGWGPGWGGPGWGGGIAWRPSTGAGSSRPHNFAQGNGVHGSSVRPVTTASANRVTGASSSRRPGNLGYGNATSSRPGYSGSATNSRPGQYSGTTSSRPGTVTSSGNRGRNGGSGVSTSSSQPRRSSGSVGSSSSSSSSRSSYNSGSRGSSSSSRSSGSYSTGSGSRGGYGGSSSGSRGGGGGGSRGGGGGGRGR